MQNCQKVDFEKVFPNFTVIYTTILTSTSVHPVFVRCPSQTNFVESKDVTNKSCHICFSDKKYPEKIRKNRKKSEKIGKNPNFFSRFFGLFLLFFIFFFLIGHGYPPAVCLGSSRSYSPSGGARRYPPKAGTF